MVDSKIGATGSTESSSTSQALVQLRDVSRELKGRDWTPSVELAGALVNAAAVALEQSDDPADVREVRDGLILAERLFKLRGARLLEANLITAQRLRTERRLGLILPGPGGDRKSNSYDTSLIRLRDFGVSWDKAAAFKHLADIDEQDLESWIAEKIHDCELSTALAITYWKEYIVSERASERLGDTANAPKRARSAGPHSEALPTGIYVEDIRLWDELPDDSVDLIFTDPPYGKAALPTYEAIAKVAKRVLKPGASLLAYTGQSVLPEVLNIFGESLNYWWTINLVHRSGNQQMPGKWVYIGWKPIVWYVKGTSRAPEYVRDTILMDSVEKSHWWEQGIEPPKYYIEHLTEPGGFVFDPCCGTGTTLVAAAGLERRYLGLDISPAAVEKARERLVRVQGG